MGKIYSRDRIRIRKVYIIIFLFLILIFILFLILKFIVFPIFDVACDNWAKEFANEISIIEVRKIMNKYSDSKFMNVVKDKERKHRNDRCRYDCIK